MNYSPLQKMENLIKKSSYYLKDGYNPSALFNNNKEEDTRFLVSFKLAEVADDLDIRGLLSLNDFRREI